MPRSSESVASLAAALAKAQAELVNPEKSLTATIRSGRAGEGERSFRYAPLSSGLDIVRKTLSKHEIATLQTTSVDAATRVVNLTTMLAHTSGEWIASDWPVCSVAETANPQRMGAALTYARRYGLFTLVGIAGEDDLDAPDLCNTSAASGSVSPPSTSNGNLPRGDSASAAKVPGPRVYPIKRPPSLDTAKSAALRDQMLSQIEILSSAVLSAAWAKDALPNKNVLTADDARLIESAFERKLLAFSAELAEAAMAPHDGASAREAPAGVVGGEAPGDAGGGIDKSVLAFPEPRRQRSREHLRFVARQACLLCGRQPSDAHHVRYAQPRALGRKSSDEFTVPLCRIHHRAVHRVGDERGWWRQAGIDPLKVARRLWKRTRGLPEAEAAGPRDEGAQPVSGATAPPLSPGLEQPEHPA